MKKLLPLLLIALIAYSCNVTPVKDKRRFSNVQQENFENMLIRNYNTRMNLANDIQQTEFDDSVKLALGKYMDSVQVFVNWEGIVVDIRSDSFDAISLGLEYLSRADHKVIFHVNYVMPKDKKTADKVYQTIKNLSNGTPVYFDGFIAKRKNGEIKYAYPKVYDNEFDFYILDVNTKSKGDTLPVNLRKAIDLSSQINKLLRANFYKKLSDREYNKKLKEIGPKFTSAKDALSQEDKDYLDRFTAALTDNFLNEEDKP